MSCRICAVSYIRLMSRTDFAPNVAVLRDRPEFVCWSIIYRHHSQRPIKSLPGCLGRCFFSRRWCFCSLKLCFRHTVITRFIALFYFSRVFSARYRISPRNGTGSVRKIVIYFQTRGKLVRLVADSTLRRIFQLVAAS